MFILADQRDEDPVGSFERYDAYLKEQADRFPEGAYALADSDWWFGDSDPKSPHDAGLVSIQLVELDAEDVPGGFEVAIEIRLEAASGQGQIELHYPRVASYELSGLELGFGHHDWRYDEFRLSETGLVIHEIEWAHMGETARWTIEAADVVFEWAPRPI